MASVGSRAMRFVKGRMMRHLPEMISCVEFEEFIVDYLEDQLEPRTRRRFELHLRFCRECREYLVAYQHARQLGRKSLLVSEQELAEVPPDLITAILNSRNSDEQ